MLKVRTYNPIKRYRPIVRKGVYFYITKFYSVSYPKGFTKIWVRRNFGLYIASPEIDQSEFCNYPKGFTKFGCDAILAFKSPATKLTNQNCDDFGLFYIARHEIDQSELRRFWPLYRPP